MTRRRRSAILAAASLIVAAVAGAHEARAQFGQNKVQYETFDWKVVTTEHVRLHHYGISEETARDAARIAEAGYAGLSRLLGHDIDGRVPILLYASPNHFRQTNAVSGLLGEGTGGVTESFRRRVILPFTGSYGQLAHVMTHEITHAFQFDLMRGGFFGVRTGPPLWAIEGMAEYASVGRDPFTDMWVRDALRHDKLPTLRQLAGVGDIRVYRLGQAAWAYVADVYGREATGRAMLRASAGASIDSSLSALAGVSADSVSRAWHAYERGRLDVGRGTEASAAGRALTVHERYMDDFHIAPALSPDGSKIAYFTNEDLFIDLVISDTRDGKNRKRLLRGGRSATFESLRFLDSAASFSPDGTLLAVVSTTDGRDVIRLLDARSGIVRRTLDLDTDGLSSPTWSPDGRRIAVVGLAGGWSDLYVMDADGGNARRLTNDRYAALHPSWSPDGRSIAFATDDGSPDELEALALAPLHVGLYDLETGRVRVITSGDADDISPVWSPEGDAIAFASSRDGRYNIYTVPAEGGEPRRLTDLVGGAVGITELSPCLTWSASGALAFTAFDKGGWDVHIVDDVETLASRTEVAAQGEAPERGRPPAFAEVPGDSAYAAKDASRRLGLNMLSGAVGFGSNVGFAGQSQIWLSDIFGDRNLVISADVYGDITESNLAVAYYNLGHRLQYGLQAFQFRDDFGFFTLPDSAGFHSQIFRGAALIGSLPKNRFLRVEGTIEGAAVEDRIIAQSYDTDSVTVANKGVSYYAAPSVALVYDNSIFGGTGPLAGRRMRLDVETTFGDLRSTMLLADLRSYGYIGRLSAFARRVAVGGTYGDNARLFRLGGPFTFRGADYGEMAGTRAAFANLELRFSVFPRLSVLYVVPFVDVAAAWNDTDSFRFASSEGGWRLQGARAAYGIGFRLGLGGLVLRHDIGQPTDLRENLGKARHFFTIAPDF